ncbi:MAG: PAS domain-containing protein [Betaproteobacteria bacterium]|nr:PAS domain-containing protein [Betaproteobacteria bacterium]
MKLAGRHFTIRARIFALVLAATLPLVALAFALGVMEYLHAREVSVDRARSVARNVAVRIEAHLAGLEATLQRLAERPRVKSLDPAACDAAIADYVSLHPQFTTLVVRRANGGLVCSSRKDTLPTVDPERFSWFEPAVRAGGFRASGAFVDPHTARWVTVLTYPIRGATGEVSGIAILPLDLDSLGQRLRGSIPDDFLVGVIDADDRYLIRSRRGDTYQGQPLAPHIARALRASAGDFEAEGPDGVARQYAHQPIAGPGWRVAAGIEQDTLVAASRRQLAASIAFFVPFLLAVFFVTWRLGRTIADPIRDLANTATRLAEGDSGARAAGANLREIDEVARQLNRMLEVQATHREALLASERRFRDLVENVPNIAVQGYDRERRVTFWNDASERLYGWSPDEALGRRLEDLIIPPPIREIVIEQHARWVRGGPGIPASELVLQRKDGSPVSVFSSHSMRADAHGDPEMYCIDVDLTALKRAEQEVAAWRERYRTAILASGQVIHEWDPATDTLSIFGDTRRILGYAPEELAGSLDRWRALLHPEDQPRFDEEAGRSRRTGTPFRLEYRVRHRNGEWLFVEDNGYFVRDASGAIDCLVCFVVDVTARHRADERIREQLEELRRWHAAMLGREGRLLDLKREVNAVMGRLGEPPRYPSAETAGSGETA